MTRSIAGLRERIKVDSGIEVGSDTEFRIDEAVDLALTRRAEAEVALARASKALRDATRDAISALKSAGVGNRDIGEIVGLSRSRVQQLDSEREPAPASSAKSAS